MACRAAGWRSPASRAIGAASSPGGSSATRESSTWSGSTRDRRRSTLERTEFIEADLRNPVLSRLLPVDRGRHRRPLRDPAGTRSPARPPRVLHDINVIGTLQLLAACERTDDPRHVIVRGSAAIYGCEGAVAAVLHRGPWPEPSRCGPGSSATSASSRSYFENFARRHPDLTCACSASSRRSAAGLDSPLVRYLSLPVVPVQLGFDPRLQLLHADDATGALVAAVAQARSRAVNVAPNGSISLSRMLRILAPAGGADPAPAVRADARRGSAAVSAPGRSTATGCGCCASGAGSTTAACARSSATSPASTPSTRSATSPQG